jgi:general secretion pathway protein J
MTTNITVKKSHGFTLIELLIAIVIFAIVAIMAMGGYNELIKQREHAAETMLRVRTVQRAVARITQDMMQLEPRPVRDSTASTVNPALYINSNGCLLELTRAGWTNPVGMPRSTLQRVCYRLSDNKLYRDYWASLDRNLSNTPQQAELLGQITSMTFRFMDGNHQWQTTWPANSTGGTGNARARALPLAVEVTLKLSDWGDITRIIEIAA